MRDTATRSDEALAILIDITECIGCRGCMEACMLRRGIEDDPFEVEQLSAKAYTVVEEFGDADYFARRMCMHCEDPTCASACPVEAIRKTELGPVIYEARRCLGCRYCMMACPFDVPRYEWTASVPSIAKCDMCVDRQLRGEVPACVEACPVEATISGTRSELLAEAHRRIDADPDRYTPHVYGEHEVGGTSVLFLSPVPFEELNFRMDLGNEPLPNRTAKVIEQIPDVLTIGGAFLASVWWITNRRGEVALAERAAAAGEGDDGARTRPMSPLSADSEEDPR
jgi:formate dehydrogenase iron-sulfur subunit